MNMKQCSSITLHISEPGESTAFQKTWTQFTTTTGKYGQRKEPDIFLSQHYVVSARYEEISSDWYVKTFVIIITVQEKCLWTEARKQTATMTSIKKLNRSRSKTQSSTRVAV